MGLDLKVGIGVSWVEYTETDSRSSSSRYMSSVRALYRSTRAPGEAKLEVVDFMRWILLEGAVSVVALERGRNCLGGDCGGVNGRGARTEGGGEGEV